MSVMCNCLSECTEENNFNSQKVDSSARIDLVFVLGVVMVIYYIWWKIMIS